MEELEVSVRSAKRTTDESKLHIELGLLSVPELDEDNSDDDDSWDDEEEKSLPKNDCDLFGTFCDEVLESTPAGSVVVSGSVSAEAAAVAEAPATFP